MCNTCRWGQVCFYSVSVIICYLAFVHSAEVGQLTFCEPTKSENTQRSLVFVSTLDGKISALDAGNEGKKLWTLDFNQGPMLSSNIHRRELNNNGQWVRLIPSLSGGLYKFDGENIDAVPISTEQLLHSSFRYSDDLVFSGGKETRTYGISSTTGRILYECGIGGCTNNTDGESYIEQEVLVVQRFQQTVRAVEPRTGIERWNYSVGQHDLVLIPRVKTDCHEKITPHALDIDIKVVVPEGLIWAINQENPSKKLWQHKFDSPVVAIWREDAAQDIQGHGNLKEVNLFNSSQWIWGSDFSVSPGLYLGMHDRQLYVQENSALKRLDMPRSQSVQSLRYPWHPYPAIGSAVTSALSITSNDKKHNELTLPPDEAESTTALSVLYNSEYINGNGFYLFSKVQLSFGRNKKCNNDSPEMIITGDFELPRGTEDLDDEENDTPVQIIIVSLWYWWKEVLIISFTTALLVNFMLTQRLLNATADTKDAMLPPLIVERHIETRAPEKQITDGNDNNDNFKSRYLTDFEPVDCLGKGGYGVVFEAKNKIDCWNYAIKRIALPNNQYSRERVLREVKALAKLDHHNIVRYFNAWIECPPAGWQEEHDKQWLTKRTFISSGFPSESTQTESKPHGSVCIDVSHTDQSSVDSACEAFELNNVHDTEDSFIVFDRSDLDDEERSVEDENSVDPQDFSTSGSSSSLSSIYNGTMPETQVKHDASLSECVVFEATNDKCREPSKRKHKRSFSLNLNKKTSNRKSTKMFLYIQMQLCQRLSLREWLKQQARERDTRRVLNIFQQIVEAVEYVHLQGLIHRDLKPSNIFFAFDDKIKIGDFGLVTAMTEGYDEAHTPGEQKENITLKDSLHTACVGTHLYMSPEQMNGQVYNYKVDIYSLGIIFFELLTPFGTDMERIKALTDLRKSIFPKDFGASYPDEYTLLNMMLDVNPNKRPTTLGIKAKPPLLNYETANGLNISEDTKWHFELPQLVRHPSVTSSSSGGSESWENVS